MHKFAVALCPQTRQVYINMANILRLWIKQEQVGPGMIYQRRAIRREVTCIEIALIGMALYIIAIRRAGVNIPYTFVVGDEVDAFSNPAWICHVAVQSE